MGLFKFGEKDRDGRQKRIEHTGRYLRASRTGGVALRAHVKAAGINLTGNTSQGVRVSTRLAKNTQIAMQNGRFVLRGRYGSDAARFNLSKSGVSVSSKTGIGTVNWIRPGRSSAKFAGVQLRGQKAAAINGVYLVLAGIGWSAKLLGRGVAVVVQWGVGRWQQAQQARERIAFEMTEIAPAGERVLAAQDVDPTREPLRDLFAALIALTAVMGRGESTLDPAMASATVPDDPFTPSLLADVNVAARSLQDWLGDSRDSDDPAPILGVLHQIARAFADRVDDTMRTEAVFAIDDACLALGERTILQDAMLDVLVESLGVELTVAGES
ncbi:hypothetical protein [Spiribacter vilamensis]|uniref:Uncharacterized protein n=1 Tax=Spiribacter vilamensis TaxID=531306 RepID=A0A4Q8D0A1_9GAMM|nr:hypothetical protein [Spiribacter vilamensis]RZU98694.1 hypothetical protein EV698_0953 [Spiribacter vilamensis]TVO62281.1 hypothetical protein FPL09_09435 [Spiribacter vilamensis]